ncbi:MAG: ABC transporter ATP-binding protein [Chromatiales bacterium]|nr:ABC transporter ATP-binding protein [Chromatiales bacterium]
MPSESLTSSHANSETLLTVANLSSRYGPVEVLYDVSLEIKTGELVAIVGANGAGKTTLLRTLSGLHRSQAGAITFADRDITNSSAHSTVHAGMCHVPEGRQVFAPLSVDDNLRLGAYALRKESQWVEAEMENVYSLFPILKEKYQQEAGTLSGGQQQMLAIGRALLGRPKLLLLDEPSMGLAPLLVEDIFRIIRELNAKGVTILLVEQNARMALAVADRGYVLETGRIITSAPAKELLNDEAVRKAYLGY